MRIGVLIPALNPDDKLIKLIKQVQALTTDIVAVIVVDDGSDSVHQQYFKTLNTFGDRRLHVLHHVHNQGKGAALKTGFQFCKDQCLNLTGIATMDADGQHTIDALQRCITKFERHPEFLILGVRKFTNGVPLRSQFGNVLTSKLVRMVTHQSISDTQTGLRVIPTSYSEKLIGFPGERGNDH